MTNPTRLFDCVDFQLEKFPKPDMLVAKENGEWHKYGTAEVRTIVDNFSAGLLALGLSGNDMTIEHQDKVALISNNRPEWVFTDLACQQIGIPICPIYPTTNPLEIEFILNDAAVKYVFVGNEDLYKKIQNIKSRVSSLIDVFTYNIIEGADHWSKVTGMATAELKRKVSSISATIHEENIATIIYTSGTTGRPKGVMLSHKNILSNVKNSKESFPFEDAPQSKVLSFLPLNHIFEKTCTYIYLFSGISIWYAESLDTIGDNLKEVQPNGFTTVPRLLEKVFEKIMAKGAELKGIKKSLFYWAVRLGFKYDNIKSGGWWYNLQLSIANKIIFSKWREALGGNVTFIVTGGAACQERLLRIFNAAKIPVYEGYGPTENSPVISVNRKTTGDTRFGTVGPSIVGQEVKLAEDGEIMVKGPSVMKGYYKRPDLTAEVIKDGWLLTGDIGIWVENRFLKITDRKKELFKTSGGKYVAPQLIENKFKESSFIEHVIVVGPDRKFVSALIVPDFALLRQWMKEKHISFISNEETINHPKVLQLYHEIIEKYNAYFNPVEQVKKFKLLPAEWSIETEEMTPKMSLRRKIIMEKYKNIIENIYN